MVLVGWGGGSFDGGLVKASGSKGGRATRCSERRATRAKATPMTQMTRITLLRAKAPRRDEPDDAFATPPGRYCPPELSSRRRLAPVGI
jgi:hypothetical protein